MTSVTMEVMMDGTANIVVSMMFMTVLNATNIPFVLNQTNMIMEMEGASLQPSLDDMMKIPMVTTTYGIVAPEGVLATYQPSGRDGNGKPAIWMTVHSTTGNKILSVTSDLQ
ncbi:hypothetical protein EON65_51805 [archaeon]|nr:MAG: hypothetical protein EON65_51805 [archaeon]